MNNEVQVFLKRLICTDCTFLDGNMSHLVFFLWQQEPVKELV